MSVRSYLLRTQLLLSVSFVIARGQTDPCVSPVMFQTALDLTKESLVIIRRVYRQCDKKDNPPSCYQDKAPRVKAYIAVALGLIKTVQRKNVACTTSPSLSTEQLNQLRATTETVETFLRTTSSPDIKHPDQTTEANSAEVNSSTTLSPDTTNQFRNTSSATNFVEISLTTTLSPDATNQMGYLPSRTNLEDNSLGTTTTSLSTEQLNKLRATTETIEALLRTTSSPDVKHPDQTSEANSAEVNSSTIASVDAGNPYNEELNNSLSPSTYDSSPVNPNFSLPMDCLEILQNGQNTSGVYKIQLRMPEAKRKTLDVYCDMDTDGGGWTVIQKRTAHYDNNIFLKNWTSYKYGFGSIERNFWLGNENIYFLSNQVEDQAIRFDLEDVRQHKRHATYSRFRIDNEKNSYQLHISGYSGDAGDAMSNQNGWEFATSDTILGSCSKLQRGGWWFGSCTEMHIRILASNLNGKYFPGIPVRFEGIFWYHWLEYECPKDTEMKLRRI